MGGASVYEHGICQSQIYRIILFKGINLKDCFSQPNGSVFWGAYLLCFFKEKPRKKSHPCWGYAQIGNQLLAVCLESSNLPASPLFCGINSITPAHECSSPNTSQFVCVCVFPGCLRNCSENASISEALLVLAFQGAVQVQDPGAVRFLRLWDVGHRDRHRPVVSPRSSGHGAKGRG